MEGETVRSLSAHSFRVGLTQDLLAAGEDGAGIALALRWSSPTIALRYTRELAVGSNAAARVLGSCGERVSGAAPLAPVGSRGMSVEVMPAPCCCTSASGCPRLHSYMHDDKFPTALQSRCRRQMMGSTARRRQPPITIRSERARARLELLTRDGRSQAQVIEEALERMPLPPALLSREEKIARIDAILAQVPKRKYPAMAELDAELYDEEGNCR